MSPDWIPLDHAATTPLAPGVLEAMLPWLVDASGNPSSDHAAGRAARAAVEAARESIAAALGNGPGHLIFTSGATESINLALKGFAAFRPDSQLHFVSSRIEHRATLDALRWLQAQGHRVTWLSPDARGRHSAAQVLDALRPETAMVSLMAVNNEIGTINPVAELAVALRERGVVFHVDATQALPWMALDLSATPIDLLSFSAHKLGGPKGIGALYVSRKPRVPLAPLLHGGGHEAGLRSGTLAVHQIVGFAAACDRLGHLRSVVAPRLTALKARLWEGLAAGIPGLLRNDDPDGAPHILNLSVPGVDGESLRARLPMLLCSSGSACSSATREPSYVLRALGRSDALARASLRLSLGEGNTSGHIEAAIAAITTAVATLRAWAPEVP